YYHNTGQSVEADLDMTPFDWKKYGSGTVHILNGSSGGTDESTRIVFSDKKLSTQVLMNADSNTRVYLGDGPFKSVQNRVPLVMFSRQGNDVIFAAVIEPKPTGTDFGLTKIAVSGQKNCPEILIDRGGNVDKVSLDPFTRIDIALSSGILLSVDGIQH
ncbi:MAG: hypothetical protein GX811_03240, partial [Lentisphaerae bacterium]|nr:hypothetical protein [Lentisphaerota bacterium]